MVERSYRNWSAVQTVLGVVVVGLGVAAIGMNSKFSNTAVPLWSGAWFIATGLIGISTARKPTNSCMIGSHLVFCIVSVMYAINMTVLFATASREEQETDSGASPAARAAIDICITIAGMLQMVICLRCMMYACRLCGAGDYLSRSSSGHSREIEVSARHRDSELPSPSATLEPPSYAYANSLAQQSYEIRFANGDYPSVPPHDEDEPPSYSEVIAGTNGWTPTSLQIQISYAPPNADERQHERSADTASAVGGGGKAARQTPNAAVTPDPKDQPSAGTSVCDVTTPNAVIEGVTTASNTTAGNVRGSHATAPNATASNATEPNATASNATEPNATASNVTEPNATAPNATEPNVAAPNAELPNASPPIAPAPLVIEPNGRPDATHAQEQTLVDLDVNDNALLGQALPTGSIEPNRGTSDDLPVINI